MTPSSGNPTSPVPGTSSPLTNSPFYEYVMLHRYVHVIVIMFIFVCDFLNLSFSQIFLSLCLFLVLLGVVLS